MPHFDSDLGGNLRSPQSVGPTPSAREIQFLLGHSDFTEKPPQRYIVSKASECGDLWSSNPELQDAFGKWDDLPGREKDGVSYMVELYEKAENGHSESCIAADPKTKTMIVSHLQAEGGSSPVRLEFQFLWKGRQLMVTERIDQLAQIDDVGSMYESMVMNFQEDTEDYEPAMVWVQGMPDHPSPPPSNGG